MPKGEGGGQPRSWKTTAQLQKDMDAYFASCFEEQWVDQPIRNEETGQAEKDDKGNYIMKPVKVITQVKPFTVTGMCVFLNVHKDTLLVYERGEYDTETDKYSDIVKAAKLKVESQLEEKLHYDVRHTGLIFVLKNKFGWKDQKAVDLTTDGDKIIPHLSPVEQERIENAEKLAAKAYEEARKLNP